MKKVWHRGQNGWWYATIREGGRRQQIRLIRGPATPAAKQQAEEALIRELSVRLDQGDVDAQGDLPWMTVGHVIAGFLTHAQRDLQRESHAWYKTILTAFAGKWGTLRIGQLRKQHVLTFIKARYDNPTSQNRGIGAIKRAFNWAVEEEHIPRSPITHVRKPKSHVRDRVLDPAERALILSSIRDQAFKDYFLALSLTGCRPGELAKVTAAEVQLDRGLWVLPKHKTAKRTGRPRVIYLAPDALEITKRLVAAHPDGPIFRNRYGRPWGRNAVRLRFQRLRKRHPQLEGVVAYTLRSTFATDALEAGVPDASVAELLGHTNTDTLHKFYARLSHRVGHLQDAAAKAARVASGPACNKGNPDVV